MPPDHHTRGRAACTRLSGNRRRRRVTPIADEDDQRADEADNETSGADEDGEKERDHAKRVQGVPGMAASALTTEGLEHVVKHHEQQERDD